MATLRPMLVLALALTACRSTPAHAPAQDGDAPPDDATTSDDASTTTSSAERDPSGCEGPLVAKAPLRRMSAVQYRNTVRDLFGGLVAASDAFPPTVLGELYTNDLDANPVSQLGVEQLMNAGEEVALAVVEHASELGICDGAIADACARAWLEGFAARAWRRPLRLDEHTSLFGLYDASGAPTDALAATVTAILQSPSFLYLLDDGEENDGVVVLDDYAIATRLSYLLWDTMPDDALFAAAAAGTLGDTDGIASEVQRMLDDHERTAPAIGRFYAEWLGLVPLRASAKDATLFPELDDALATAIDRELVDYVADVVLGEDPTLAALLTSSRTHVDATLAPFFGVELDERSGVLARPAVVARHASETSTSPTRRGLMVRTRLLCETIPPPPPGAMQNAPALPPDATARERSQALIDAPSCGGCHARMDLVGLGFEHFDALGRWRDGDAAGELVGVTAFDGTTELQSLLAEDDAVADCLVQHWLRHVFGLDPSEVDACVLADLRERFAASGGDLRELVALTATSDAFRMRRAEAP